MPELRPMRIEDVEEVHALNVLTFDALSASRNEPPEPPPPDPTVVYPRYRHLVETDPEGAWVATHDGAIVGCALALRREDVWGLSLLIVRPDTQSSGTGSALLRRANEYADGARGRIIMASSDPRALRAYFRLGLDFHPAAARTGSRRPAGAGRVPRGRRERHPVHGRSIATCAAPRTARTSACSWRWATRC